MAFDVEYDVVICGGGASGQSAAYIVGTESDLSVCLLEKMPEIGGTSQYAEGTCASESIEQQERGIPDYPGELPEGAHFPTHKEHYHRYLEYSHFRANPDVVRAFVWNSPETIEIYRKLGIEYSDVTIYAFDQPLELYTFHRPEGLGARCMEVLNRACINAGVDFFCNTCAQELIFEGDEIVGVKAIDVDGNELRVGAKAIILACGGFGNNLDMVEKYSWNPGLKNYNYKAIPTENTGEGINMAISAGAATRALGTLMIQACTIGKTLPAHESGAGCQPNLWINSDGRRICNEKLGMSFAETGNTIAQTKDGIVWSIFDEKTLVHMEQDGSDIGLGDWLRFHQPLDHLRGEMAESLAADDGSIAKADTIEGLAEAMGVPVDAFKATVERYNELCAKGDDEDYFKDAQYMRPLAEAPFYAIHQAPCILVSDGGIRVNGNMQVVDEAYVPVKGGNLYSVGNEASGLYGDTYNLDCPGTANGFAHTSGRIAARHAISQLKG